MGAGSSTWVGLAVMAVVVLVPLGGFIFGSEYLLRRQGYRPAQKPPSVRLSSFDEADAVSFTGGSRIGWSNATVPNVRLTADRRRAAFGDLPTVVIDRSSVVGVRKLRGLMGPGIMFDAHDGRYDGAIFWTFDPHRRARSATGPRLAGQRTRGERRPVRRRQQAPSEWLNRVRRNCCADLRRGCRSVSA